VVALRCTVSESFQLQRNDRGAGHAATSWKQMQETLNVIHHNFTYSTMQEKAINVQSAIEGKYPIFNDPTNIFRHKRIGHLSPH
jgi:hypothetical protein